MQPQEMTDEELICRIQQGENDLFEPLIRRYYDDVYSFCCYKIGDRQLACDCTQEIFLKLIRYIHTYSEKNKFKGYLFSIARNVCIDFFRTRPRELPDSDGLLEIPEPGDAYGQKELAQVVEGALENLSDEQKEAVILRFYYDFKIREIAKITGVSLPTAKSRLRRGMASLKKILEKEGLGYAG